MNSIHIKKRKLGGSLPAPNNSLPTLKKLSFSPFSSEPKAPDDYLNSLLNAVSTSISSIQKNIPLSFSLEQLFRFASNICISQREMDIYSLIFTSYSSYINNIIIELSSLPTTDETSYIETVNIEINKILNQITMLKKIFLFYEKMAIINNSIDKIITNIIKECFLKNDVCSKTFTCINNIKISSFSNSKFESLNKERISSLIKMISKIDIYEEYENYVLNQTLLYYSSLYKKDFHILDWISSMDKILKLELLNNGIFYTSSTYNAILDIIYKIMLKDHIDEVINENNVFSLFNNNNLNELKILYVLLLYIREEHKLKGLMEKYILLIGNYIINNDPNMYNNVILHHFKKNVYSSSSKNIINNVLVLYKIANSFIKKSFSENFSLFKDVFYSFESFLNTNTGIIELYCLYIHHLLVNSYSNTKLFNVYNNFIFDDECQSSNEFDIIINNLMNLFKYLKQKDIFILYYKLLLSYRLLYTYEIRSDSSAILKYEKEVISKMKNEIGNNNIYINKYDIMFNDIFQSNDLNNDFQFSNDIELYISVLTTGSWPSFPLTSSLSPPENILSFIGKFEEFYKEKYGQNRKLSFYHNLSTISVIAHLSKSYLFILSYLQFSILNLFNSYDELSLNDMCNLLNISENELKIHLISLMNNNTSSSLIIKVANNKKSYEDIQKDDILKINLNYFNKLYKVKFNSFVADSFMNIQQFSSSSNVYTMINNNNNYQLDSCIIRIMKYKRVISFTDLVTEIISHIIFDISEEEIKKRVQSLIEREYIERDPDNHSLFHYIA